MLHLCSFLLRELSCESRPYPPSSFSSRSSAPVRPGFCRSRGSPCRERRGGRVPARWPVAGGRWSVAGGRCSLPAPAIPAQRPPRVPLGPHALALYRASWTGSSPVSFASFASSHLLSGGLSRVSRLFSVQSALVPLRISVGLMILNHVNTDDSRISAPPRASLLRSELRHRPRERPAPRPAQPSPHPTESPVFTLLRSARQESPRTPHAHPGHGLSGSLGSL